MGFFELFLIALASSLFSSLAQVKTEVGAFNYTVDRGMFPNLNVDGLTSAFQGVMQDKNGDFLVIVDSTMIIKFSPGSNVASLVAGLGTSTDNGVQATSAQIASNTFGLAGDTVGNVYYSELNRHCIRRVGVNGVVNTFAGACGSLGNPVDSVPATTSRVRFPRNIFYHIQSNCLFIGETGSFRVRMVSASTNIITTVLGTVQGNVIDVAATSALIGQPYDVWVDSNGLMYVTDFNNYRIIRAATTPGAIVSLFLGAGVSTATAYPNGIAATSAQIGSPISINGDTSGNIYFLGWSGSIVYRCTSSNMMVYSYAQNSAGSGIIHNGVWGDFFSRV